MLLRKDIEVVITALTRNQVCGNASWVRIPLFPPSLLYEKATTDKKHKILLILCFLLLYLVFLSLGKIFEFNSCISALFSKNRS